MKLPVHSFTPAFSAILFHLLLLTEFLPAARDVHISKCHWYDTITRKSGSLHTSINTGMWTPGTDWHMISWYISPNQYMHMHLSSPTTGPRTGAKSWSLHRHVLSRRQNSCTTCLYPTSVFVAVWSTCTLVTLAGCLCWHLLWWWRCVLRFRGHMYVVRRVPGTSSKENTRNGMWAKIS